MKNQKYIGDLINRFTPEIILDAYYGLTPQPRDRNQINPNYVGKLHHYNNPFQYCIEGAYPLKFYYEHLMYQIKTRYFHERYGVSDADISEAFKVYGKNFQI